MNKNIIQLAMVAVFSLLTYSCVEESIFGENYDVNLPAATISEVSDIDPFVGDQIVLKGKNMKTITSVAVGTSNFKIIAQYDDSMRVQVPRQIESGPITIMNKYKREFKTTEIFKPQYYTAVISTWPVNIEKGKPFMLKGSNLDLIKELKLNGTAVSVFGDAASDKVSYSSAGVAMEIGDKVIIEMTPRTGNKQISGEIEIIRPKNTYVPKQTLMLFDFDAPYTAVKGDAEGKGYSFTYKSTKGFFGNALEVSAASGNGWSGIYLKVENDNGGQGYDLSSYNKPYITMLVNTNGGFGYVQPILTAGGSTNDRHFTGAYGYGDDYKMKTNGWEWRSYDLVKMGFPVVKGKLDKIGIQFRGGNVNGTPFYVAVDQVMITDGPLTPGLIWDAEAAAGGDLPITFNGGTGLNGYYQGDKYMTYKYTVGSDTWSWLGNVMSVGGLKLDPIAYANGIYLNFLVNTGDSEGYAGIQIVQGSNKLANQKLDPAYGDNYKFRKTNGNWEWRSMKFDISSWDVWGGSAAAFDITKDFTLSFYARGGNIASGVNAQLHMDYFMFTTVPLDPKLVSE